MRKTILFILAIALIVSQCSMNIHAQEVIPSASGDGYGGSGTLNPDAAWLTGGTAIRVFPAPIHHRTGSEMLASAPLFYRYLPFALYMSGDNGLSLNNPVHYNMHLSPDGTSYARSVLPKVWDIENPQMKVAFEQMYESAYGTANERVSKDNLFVKRMLEMQAGGAFFKTIDWSVESEPALVKQFFFSDDNPLAGEWAEWFDSWPNANRAILADYCGAATFLYMVEPLEGNYTLPNNEYQEDSGLDLVSYEELYTEMIALYQTSDAEEQNWALVFEPVADFYPDGNPEARAWTSAREIAMVMAEKIYSYDGLLYGEAVMDIFGIKKIPSDGQYSRYQATLAYALRNTGAFDNFLFRQARAIFTNNYSGDDYVADQFLLVDSLRPEVENANGFLGGWAVVYLRDILPPTPVVDTIKGMSLVEITPSATHKAYGKLATFTGSAAMPEMHWWATSSATKSAYLNGDADYLKGVMSDMLGVSLKDDEPIYAIGTREIRLSAAVATSLITKLGTYNPAINASNLERVAQPVGANIIGTAKYAPTEANLIAVVDKAADTFMSMLQNASGAHASASGRTQAALRSAYTMSPIKPALITGKADMNGEYALLGKNTTADISAVAMMKNENPLLAEDGQNLLQLTGTIPVIVGVRMPSKNVKARIIEATLGETIDIMPTTEIEFDIGDQYCYTLGGAGIAVNDVVVLGWKNTTVNVDANAITNTLKAQIASGGMDLNALQTTYGADIVRTQTLSDKVCGSATKVGSDFDGYTAVIIYVEAANLDLAIETLESTVPIGGSVAYAKVKASNDSSGQVSTIIKMTVDNPSQERSFPVILDPGLTEIELPYGTDPEGGPVHIIVELNPERQPAEVDYSNNVKELDIVIPPFVPPVNIDEGCTDRVTWNEAHYHTWRKLIPTRDGWDYITVYCYHGYTYSLSVSGYLSGIDNYGASIKSGYGVSPRARVIGSGPRLIGEKVLVPEDCNGEEPSSNSEATILWADEAVFSWEQQPAGGHSYRDYDIVNPEKGTSQPATNIPMEFAGISGGIWTPPVAEFITAENPLSMTNQRKIYLNVALRDGIHKFRIDMTGSITYGTWSQCLWTTAFGEVRILGNMYEDDFTGAAIP